MMRRMLKQRSVRGAAATFIGQGTRFFLQLLSQVLLARLLLPAEFGLVAMIGPVLSFVGIFNELGLSQATVQRPSITHQELSNLFWINVAVSSALALLMCGAAPLIALFYNEPRLTAITMWLATMLVVGGLSAQQLALMNRHMRFGQLATIDVACTFMAVAVGCRRCVARHGILVAGVDAGGQWADHNGNGLGVVQLAAILAQARGWHIVAAAFRQPHDRL